MDVNGNQWDTCPGLTNSGSTNAGYVLFSGEDDWTAVNANSGITGAANKITLMAESAANADDGVWWTSAAAYTYLVPHSGGTWHPASRFGEATIGATLRALTESGIPRQLGTGASAPTNLFGGDGLYVFHRSDLLPAVGGFQGGLTGGGVFCLNLGTYSTISNNEHGARACRLLSA